MDVERRDDRTFTPYTPPSFHETRSLAATSTILNGWINEQPPPAQGRQHPATHLLV
jgi:hypothetical protein